MITYCTFYHVIHETYCFLSTLTNTVLKTFQTEELNNIQGLMRIDAIK